MNTEDTRKMDAILAGLRLLAHDMTHGAVKANDGAIGDILTNAGEHDGLTVDEVDALADELVEAIEGVLDAKLDVRSAE